MLDLPLISIGLLVYNHERYIRDSLEGLLSQTYEPLEVIILDDASNDDTKKIIQSYLPKLKKKFFCVKPIYNLQNSGNIAMNCNCMIRHSTGEFYYSISGDDILLPNGIELLYRTLIANPLCNVIYANMICVEDSFHFGDFYDKNELIYKDRKSGTESDTLFFRLMDNNFISAPTVMRRMQLFQQYGYHDEIIPYEDYEYWLRLSLSEKFFFLQAPVVLYRRSNSSYSNYSDATDSERKLYIAIEAEYKTKKKYIDFLTTKEKTICLKNFYKKYYIFCRTNKFTGPLQHLQTIMKNENVEIENTDIEICKKREKENKILEAWSCNKELTQKIISWLRKNGSSSISIYGYSRFGKKLLQELDSSAIKVTYIIDEKGRMLNAPLPVYMLEDALPPVDLVVISIIDSPKGLCRHIRDKIKRDVIDIDTLLSFCKER